MGRLSIGFATLFCAWAVAQTLSSTPAQAQLDPFYYFDTCPEVFPIVGAEVLAALQKDPRIAASILRLHFHDCFVQGCDASVLLDGPGTEKTAPPNNNSLRGFDVIDKIKGALETACPDVVSCADTVTLATFFGIVLSGGPGWVVPLGRRDALAPNFNKTLTNLAPPSSTIANLTAIWKIQNFTAKQLVSLSGAHTIGDSRCAVVGNSSSANRNPQLNSARSAFIQQLCLNGNAVAVSNVTGMDVFTPTGFDNRYFKQFPTNNELFKSDAALLNSSETATLVQLYASNQAIFFLDFADSMIRMGNLNVSTAPKLEVRKNCSVVNPPSSRSRSSSVLRMPVEDAVEPQIQEAPRELSQKEKDQYLADVRAVSDSLREQYVAYRLQMAMAGFASYPSF